MTLRTAISLYVLETMVSLVAVIPVALAVTVVTLGLPPGLSLLGTDGPPVLSDALVNGGLGVFVCAAVTALLFVVHGLFVAPLLMAGTIHCLEGEARPGPVRLVVTGVLHYPRYLVLHLVFVVVSAAACTLLVWLVGFPGAVAAAALILALWAARDVVSASMHHPGPAIRSVSRAMAMVRKHPVSMAAGFLLQASAGWLLCLAALQVQVAFHEETVLRALVVTAVAQVMLLVRCMVRCGWLRILVHIDS